ncbi:MAG: peroxiredoxin [Deltaproteobacteria bacterium]|nr:peroxiredoxin [Deltaproteobacteria bacterium]
MTIPTINSQAPDFTAKSTHGDITLSEIIKKGKWVVLFSHPADFTPVCTTELVRFAQLAPEFEKRDVQLLGLSIDSVYSHLEWVHQIEHRFETRVPYPLIADLDMKVANLYGMVHPGASETATVRAVFVIDNTQKIRAMIYYPLTNGRSIDEVLRIVDALQTNSKHAVATPEGWRPGDKVIVPPPVTYAAQKAREADTTLERTTWWFSKKSL